MEKIIRENAFEEKKIIDLRTTGRRTLEPGYMQNQFIEC